jgi:hypothetical protein
MKPSVGRGVHYVSAGHSLGTYSSTCRAAIVTDVQSDTEISVAVFSGKGLYFYEAIELDEGKAGGTWHWPETADAPTSSILKQPPPRRG